MNSIYDFRLLCIVLVCCLSLGNTDCDGRDKSATNNQNSKTIMRVPQQPPATLTLDTTAAGSEIIWGVTTDTVPYKDKEVKKFLGALEVISRAHRPMIRIIIDTHKADDKLPYADVEQYKAAIRKDLDHYKRMIERIKEHSDVMVMISDSYYMYAYKDSAAYRQKTRAYVQELRGLVNVWEIGNEVNGEWVGWNDKEWASKSDADLKLKRELVAAQINAAYEEVKSEGGKVALTLYLNANKNGGKCWEKPEYEMFSWADTFLKNYYENPENTKHPVLDYVFISFYEDDCPRVLANPKEEDKDQKDIQIWTDTFNTLAGKFGKDTKLGFGEVSPQCKYKECGYDEEEDDLDKVDRTCLRCKTAQKDFISRYYVVYHKGIVSNKVPRFVGGYFYWYFYKDMVVKKNPVLDDLIRAIQSSRQ